MEKEPEVQDRGSDKSSEASVAEGARNAFAAEVASENASKQSGRQDDSSPSNGGRDNTTRPETPPLEITGLVNGKEPAQAEKNPVKQGADNPANPATDNPANPGTDNPANPGTDNPANPGTDNPANPGTDNPANPGTDNPATPAEERPDKPREHDEYHHPNKDGSETIGNRNGERLTVNPDGSYRIQHPDGTESRGRAHNNQIAFSNGDILERGKDGKWRITSRGK